MRVAIIISMSFRKGMPLSIDSLTPSMNDTCSDNSLTYARASVSSND
jgi:hypothetical protein